MPVLRIPVTKAGKGVFVEFDTDQFNLDDYPGASLQMVLFEGLKSIVNSRNSKLKAPSKLEGKEFEDNKAAAIAQAEKNISELNSGKLVKKSAASGDAKVPREVQTEARRLAREVVRDRIKANGEKISHYASKDITAMANYLVENDSSYVKQAEENIAARKGSDDAKAKGEGLTALFSKLGIKPDAEKVAKAEKAKADRKSQLSAKQAGKVAPRKGSAPPMTAQQANAHFSGGARH